MFLGVLKFGCLFWAMSTEASAGLSSLVLQAQVFFTIALSVVFLRESINRYHLAGITIGVVGFSVFLLRSEGGITPLGLALVLMAAAFWGIANLFMKQAKGVNVLHFMIWVSLIPPVPLLMLSYIFESQDVLGVLASVHLTTWFSLAYVSYLATFIAFAMWGWLLRKYPSATVTPFALLIPVVGIFTSNILLDEKLGTHETIGAATILLGLVVCVFGQRLWGLVTPFGNTKQGYEV